MKRRFRILSILLASVLTFTSVSANTVYNVYAEEESEEDSDKDEDKDEHEESDSHDEDAHEDESKDDSDNHEDESKDDSDNHEDESKEDNNDNAESGNPEEGSESSTKPENPENGDEGSKEDASTETSDESASSEEGAEKESTAATDNDSTEETDVEDADLSELDVEIKDVDGKTYDGKAVDYGEDNIKASGEMPAGHSLIYVYSTDENGSEVIDAPKNAGEYYFVVKAKKDDSDEAVTVKSEKFEITKAKPAITVSAAEAHIGEKWEELEFTVDSVEGVEADGSLSWHYDDFSWKESGEINRNLWEKFAAWLHEDLANVKGTLVYTPSDAYSDNYDVTEVEVSIKLYKDGKVVAFTVPEEKPYDATPFNKLTVKTDDEETEKTFDDLKDEGYSVEFYKKEGNVLLDIAPTDAGEYYVTISLEGVKDERLIGKFIRTADGEAATFARYDFKIVGKDLEWNAEGFSLKYTGEEQELVSVEVPTLYERDGEAKVSYEWNASGTGIDSEISENAIPKAKNVGDYSIIVKVDAGANYNPAKKTVCANISKADLTVSAAAYKGTYDGEEHPLVSDISVKGENGEDVSFTTEIETVSGLKNCKEPGEYPFTVKVTATDSNYNNAEIEDKAVVEKIAIDKSKLTISANDIYYHSDEKPVVSVIYDGKVLPADIYTVDYGTESFSELSVGAHEFTVKIESEYYVSDGAIKASFNVVGIKAQFFQRTSNSGGLKDLGYGYLTEEFYNNNKDSSKKVAGDEVISTAVANAPVNIVEKHSEGEVEYYYMWYNAEAQKATVYVYMDYKPVDFYVRKSGVARPKYGEHDASYNYTHVASGKAKVSSQREGNEANDNVKDLILEKPDDSALIDAIVAAGYTRDEIADLGLNFKWYRVISCGSGQEIKYHVDGNVVKSNGTEYSHHTSYTVRALFTDGNGVVNDIARYEETVYEGGNSKSIVLTPKAGYYISSVTVAGKEQNLTGVGAGSFELPAIENVTSDIDILATAMPKADITITAASAEKEYDGEALTDDEYKISGSYDDYSDLIKVNVTGSITEAGTAENVVSYDLLGHDYMFNSVNTVNGTLTVRKKDASISVNNAEKTYGEADPDFSKDGYTVTGLVNSKDLGEIKVRRVNKAEAAGAYDDVLTASFTANPNYNVAVYNGDFVINKASDLKINVKDKSCKYDGNAHSLEVGSASAKAGDGVSYKFYSDASATKEIANSFTDAGIYNVWVKASDANHNTAMASAKVTVTPRELTLTSGSSKRAKNGKALKNDKITVTGDGFVKEEGASYDVTGSQTSVGSSKNTFDYSLKSNTLDKNYSIKKVYGKLTVTDKDDSSDSDSGSSSSSTGSKSATKAASKTAAVLGDREAPEKDDESESGVLGDRDTPNTGDSANIAVWVSLLLASGASIVSIITALARRKRED
ncbi:MBG domain-containing protein [Lachnospiraceae bacterium C1.1]|nr:MBG domain-containing protein [Lachnospiraceae bacterium C1.1]